MSKNIIEALNICNKDIFSTIYRFLIILATLLVITASSEKSFLTLWRLKSYYEIQLVKIVYMV